MKGLTKNIFLVISTLLLVVFIFSLFSSTQKQPTNLSLNQLVLKINNGEVSEISVEGNDLKIDLKNGEKAVSKKEAESGLSETLKNYGVEPAALQGVNFKIEENSGFLF